MGGASALSYSCGLRQGHIKDIPSHRNHQKTKNKTTTTLSTEQGQRESLLFVSVKKLDYTFNPSDILIEEKGSTISNERDLSSRFFGLRIVKNKCVRLEKKF